MSNGIIINYIVTYKINANSTVISTTLQLTTLSVQLTSLTPFTNYTIFVQASTTAGIGEFSDIRAQTFEDGKRTYIDLKSIIHRYVFSHFC